ncbi:MAG: hypothetical protein ABW321_04165 [Polyangiales bacterium]
MTRSAPPLITFDRPSCSCYDDRTASVLFTGRMVDPSVMGGSAVGSACAAHRLKVTVHRG